MVQVPEMFDLKGRVAVVTGAGSGLGKAYAHALSAAGASVVCADIDQSAAHSCAASIQELDQQAWGVLLNVADVLSVAQAIGETLDRFGRIDVLVNNAGVTSLPARAHEVSVADWDRVMTVNIRGMFACAREVLPTMLQLGGGSIINIASVIGLVGVYPRFAVTGVPYASSKGAVIGFTKQLAAEYAADGIRVNAIAPGWHGGTSLGKERRAKASQSDLQQFESYIADSVPMARRGVPNEMDGLLVYLASDASRYVTGQVIAHDGGLTAT